MRRVHHHYLLWEDFWAGMYRPSENIAADTALARELLTDPESLSQAMGRVVVEWPKAAEQNLTNTESNRRAWLGQAACMLYHGSRQGTTCAAWWTLTDAERDTANAVADRVIEAWCAWFEGSHRQPELTYG